MNQLTTRSGFWKLIASIEDGCEQTPTANIFKAHHYLKQSCVCHLLVYDWLLASTKCSALFPLRD